MCVLIGINQLGFGSVVPGAPPLRPVVRGVPGGDRARPSPSTVWRGSSWPCPVGQLSDRFGRRPALALGGLMTAAGNLLCAYAPNYPTFVGARFVAGVGRGVRPHRRPDRAGRHHHAGGARARDGDLPGELPLRGRPRAVSGRGAGRAIRPGGPFDGVRDHRHCSPAWSPGSGFPRRWGAGDRDVVGVARARPRRSRTQLRVLAGRIGFLLVSLVSFASRLHPHGRAVQRDPGPRPGSSAALVRTGSDSRMALGSLAGFGLRLSRRHAGGPLRPEGRDRAGDAPDQRLAAPVPAGPVLCVVRDGVASSGASRRAWAGWPRRPTPPTWRRPG